MHTIFALPEVLHLIFQHASDCELLQLAVVCRFWSPIALGILWHTLRDVNTLFGVSQHPVWRNGPFDIIDSSLLQDANGTRIRIYARYIRTLYLNSTVKLPLLLCLEANSTFSNASTLFPNLHTLYWVYPHCISDIGYFIHSGIMWLTIVLPELPASPAHLLWLSEAMATMYRLNNLRVVLQSTDSMSFWEDDISAFKSQLLYLKSFELSVPT
jgi:hypothetical protein